MSATLIALALFGCSDDGSACERLRMPVETYQTRAQCTARLDEALGSDAAMRAEYPTVYAQCLSSRQLSMLGGGKVDLRRVNGVNFAAAGL
ncbi:MULTISPECIES: hypothetical protein [Novosphingobium]|nr:MULTISPECIES: hypothetical protein [Novosphingobium]GFM27395.1 uncharacterized protein PY1_contig-01-256 [Novosphingobium sp. PY1]